MGIQVHTEIRWKILVVMIISVIRRNYIPYTSTAFK